MLVTRSGSSAGSIPASCKSMVNLNTPQLRMVPQKLPVNWLRLFLLSQDTHSALRQVTVIGTRVVNDNFSRVVKRTCSQIPQSDIPTPFVSQFYRCWLFVVFHLSTINITILRPNSINLLTHGASVRTLKPRELTATDGKREQLFLRRNLRSTEIGD
jgi:hypothetical protein